MTEVRLITSGVIAEHLSADPELVRRVLNRSRHIQPAARAGMTRLYLSDAIAQVQQELDAMEARRVGRLPRATRLQGGGHGK